MKINPDQISSFLQQNRENQRVFLLSGDEPYQLMLVADEIRRFAKAQGFTEREVLHADAQFDWGALAGSSNSLSLFSERKLIDLRIETKGPGKAGSQALRDYMKHLPEDKILLIQMPKLVGNARNAAWVKAIDKQGTVVQIWELSTPQTMAWINKKMREEGMHASADAVRLLTERVEGNLLAAAQEINKLKLLYQESEQQQIEIGEEQVLAAVSDSSRFSIFDLSNAVMQGDLRRVQHIHHNLREEGVAIQLILWALSDITRQLYTAVHQLNQGVQMPQIMKKIPRPRQKPFQQALQRMQYADWPEILQMNGKIDRLSKGQGDVASKGMARVWLELLELALTLAGNKAIRV